MPASTPSRPPSRSVIGLSPRRRLDAGAVGDPDPAVRLAAVGTIIATPETAPPLRAALAARLADTHETEEIRACAALALGLISPIPADDLASGLERWQKPRVRTAAATALIAPEGEAGAAAGPLARCLMAGDGTLRFQAVLALRGIGGAATPEIVRLIEDSEPYDGARMSGLDTLGLIGAGAESALPLAERLADAESGGVRVCARFASAGIRCGRLGPGARGRDAAVRPLLAMAEHEDEAIRLLAVERLGWLRDGVPSAADTFLRLLAEGSPAERQAAACGLARVQTPSERAVGPLRAALGDAEADVRRSAAIALSAYGSDARAALEDLLGLVRSAVEPEALRRAAGQSAKAIVGAEHGPAWA